ncbi:MAG: DUF3105 domain-containing protein [Acidimicrobiales bacterium]
MLTIRPGVIALAVGLMAVTACSGGGGLQDGESEALGDAEEGIDGVQSVRVDSTDLHTESIIDYDLRPPTGGGHNPLWWSCGFYDEPIPDEHAVHDLEHGAVWLAYSPDLPDADVELIHELVRADPKLLAAPYPDLADGEAVVATAWARQLRLDDIGDERLVEFIEQYTDGDQAPEAGATCSGTPLGEPIT